MRWIIILSFLIMASCKKEDQSSTSIQKKGNPPVANAGVDIGITIPDESTVLEAKKSSADLYTYLIWSALAPQGLLDFRFEQSSGKAFPIFVKAGTYQFELAVKNFFGEDTDTVSVNVKWAPRCNSDREVMAGANSVPIGSVVDSVPYNTTITSDNRRIIFAGGTWNQYDEWGYDPPISSSRVISFEPESKQYTSYSLSGPRLWESVAVTDNFVFVAGGYSDSGLSNLVEILDLSTGKLKTRRLAVARLDITTAVAGHKIFFAGGVVGNNPINDVEIYDMDSDSWITTTLSSPRAGFSTAVVGNKVFFAGGYTMNNRISDVVDVYDLSSQSWSMLKLPEPRTGIQTAAFDGKVYLIGGMSLYNVSKAIDIIDPVSMTMTHDCLVTGIFNSWSGGFQVPTSVLSLGDRLYVNDGGYLAYLDKNSHKWIYRSTPNVLSPIFSIGGNIYSLSQRGTLNYDNRYEIYRYVE